MAARTLELAARAESLELLASHAALANQHAQVQRERDGRCASGLSRRSLRGSVASRRVRRMISTMSLRRFWVERKPSSVKPRALSLSSRSR